MDAESALFTAASCGDAKKVDELLARIPEEDGLPLIRETDYRGRTALHLAAEHGHDGVVDVLIGRDNIELDAEDSAGFTALHLAVEFGHHKIVAQLLAKNADLVGDHTSKGLTCLHLAAIKGHLTIVKQLLATNVEFMETDESDNVALDYAVAYDHKEIVSVLVESVKGTNDDRRAKEMFHYAVTRGYDLVMNQLLADNPHLIDTVDDEGKNALHVAAENSRHTIVHQLLAAKQPGQDEVGGIYAMSLLHFAAQYGYEPVVARLLVEKPQLIDVAGVGGKSVLHLAARNGHQKVVAQLLAAKPALASNKDATGQTALHGASQCGHEQVVAQLLDHSPESINVEDADGDTALRLAVHSYHHRRWNLVAYLLTHGATQVDENMLWEILGGAKDIISDEAVKLVLDLKPEMILAQNRRFCTVLHRVFGFRNRPKNLFSEELMIKCWLMAPDALHVLNRSEETPFHVAVRSDNQFAIDLVQPKLSLDEIMGAYAKCKRECPQSIFDQLGAFLLDSLNKDVAKVVVDYSRTRGDDKQPPNKRKRRRDKEVTLEARASGEGTPL